MAMLIVKEETKNILESNQENDYKGIFYGDYSEKKYFEGGAHFSYKDLYKKLKILEKNNNDTLIENQIINLNIINSPYKLKESEESEKLKLDKKLYYNVKNNDAKNTSRNLNMKHFNSNNSQFNFEKFYELNTLSITGTKKHPQHEKINKLIVLRNSVEKYSIEAKKKIDVSLMRKTIQVPEKRPKDQKILMSKLNLIFDKSNKKTTTVDKDSLLTGCPFDYDKTSSRNFETMEDFKIKSKNLGQKQASVQTIQKDTLDVPIATKIFKSKMVEARSTNLSKKRATHHKTSSTIITFKTPLVIDKIPKKPKPETIHQETSTSYSKSRNTANNLLFNSEKLLNLNKKKFIYSNFIPDRNAKNPNLLENNFILNPSKAFKLSNANSTITRFSYDKLYYVKEPDSINKKVTNLKTHIHLSNERLKRASYDGSDYKLV